MAVVSLIVRADGLGSSHAANQAIEEAFETGLLTCASVVMAGPWQAEAAELIHRYPTWEVGLQLVLHGPAGGCRWSPVAGSAAVPSLVEPQGHFGPALPSACQPEDIARELTAQVARALLWDLRPAFLVLDGSSDCGADAIVRHLSETRGIPIWDQRLPITPLPVAQAPHLGEVIPTLSQGVYLWATRPAHDAPETWGMWGAEMAAAYQADLLALCDPAMRLAIERAGVERIRFGDHRARHIS
jgi:hypothetical protein